MIDKMYCINLWRRPDRWQLASDQFSKHGLNVERFAAIDGSEFVTRYPCDPGNNGCTLSHYFLVERAKIMGYKAIMIFEDDAELHNNFSQLLELSLELLPPDWGMLYCGGSHKEKPLPVNEFILKAQRTLTTHCYIIRETMYDLVINNFKTLEMPVDGYYSAWQKEFNCYITNPALSWQRAGHSDIQNREMNYDHIQNNEQFPGY